MIELQPTRCFSYPYIRIVLVDTNAIVLAIITALGWIIISLDELKFGVIFIFAGYLLWGPLYLNARLMISSVCVDDSGISWRLFKWTWKHHRWSSVKKLSVYLTRDAVTRRQIRQFSVDVTYDKKWYFSSDGPIIFDESIKNVQSLLDILHEYVKKHRIEVISYEHLSRH